MKELILPISWEIIEHQVIYFYRKNNGSLGVSIADDGPDPWPLTEPPGNDSQSRGFLITFQSGRTKIALDADDIVQAIDMFQDKTGWKINLTEFKLGSWNGERRFIRLRTGTGGNEYAGSIRGLGMSVKTWLERISLLQKADYSDLGNGWAVCTHCRERVKNKNRRKHMETGHEEILKERASYLTD